MRNRKRHRNRVTPKPRMQNLNHMVWIEVDVELELSHVVWNDVRIRVMGPDEVHTGARGSSDLSQYDDQ